MDTIDLDVPTIHCTACKLTIEETLDELNGITDRHVNLDAKQVAVSYDADTITPATIAAAIEDAGYPVSFRRRPHQRRRVAR